MGKLKTDPNLTRHDDVYQMLLELHEGRSEEAALRVSAKLILILANHIGDPEVLREAAALAAGSGGQPNS